MEMELEESINRCKHIVQNFKDMRVNKLPPHKFIINSEDSDCIETVLQALEKYKIEYEAFRNGEKFTAKQMKYITKEYLPKKKIENKIKELECKEFYQNFPDDYMAKIAINTIKELLEDK